jgi:hypothetical protein
MPKTWNPADFTSWLATQDIVTRDRALKDLSGDQRKKFVEWTTFENFYQAASLDIRPSSVRACDPPGPDIYCVLAGAPCFFELGQIVMQEVAKNASIAAKSDGVHAGSVSTADPMLNLFRAKATKKYETSGHPLCLLMHFNVGQQYPMGLRSLSSLLSPGEFETSQFRMVYVYNGWERRVLEVLSRKGETWP